MPRERDERAPAGRQHAGRVAALAAQGVTDFTVSAAVLEQMLADELTVAAAAEFESVARG